METAIWLTEVAPNERQGKGFLDHLANVNRVKIVITNYHAFKRRERVELSKGGRALLQARVGDDLDTLETEGQILQRVMPELMELKNILVLNDEAHHCCREKPRDQEDDDLKGDERKEAERNNEAARLWISGWCWTATGRPSSAAWSSRTLR